MGEHHSRLGYVQVVFSRYRLAMWQKNPTNGEITMIELIVTDLVILVTLEF